MVLTARKLELGQEAAAEIGAATGRLPTVRQLDIANPPSVAAFAEWVQAELGSVDVLVNNAGAAADSWGRRSWDLWTSQGGGGVQRHRCRQSAGWLDGTPAQGLHMICPCLPACPCQRSSMVAAYLRGTSPSKISPHALPTHNYATR